ncbi:MAG: hypothetical protein KTR25_11405 [Myxococcales bacterium]|nr:hypothetical protein [Myxococcales bacterium]
MKNLATSTLTLIVVLGLTSTGLARGIRRNQVPTQPNGCILCHVNPDGGPRTDFGKDVEDTLLIDDGADPSTGVVDWPTVCARDSDNDGSSNGEELGDPNCTWAANAPATTQVSNPNVDENAIGPTIDEDDSGCSATGYANASSAALWLMVMGFGWFVRRKKPTLL